MTKYYSCFNCQKVSEDNSSVNLNSIETENPIGHYHLSLDLDLSQYNPELSCDSIKIIITTKKDATEYKHKLLI